jgi:hypothetical protein
MWLPSHSEACLHCGVRSQDPERIVLYLTAVRKPKAFSGLEGNERPEFQRICLLLWLGSNSIRAGPWL